MVYLNRIYTRTGDEGQTSLGNGDRVFKTSLRIQAYGGVDELNSLLGVVRMHAEQPTLRDRLGIIQNDLFDVGADLCVPPAASDDPGSGGLRIVPGQVTRLEGWIDEATLQLQPLTSFILPGGTSAAAYLHLARAVCRRVEIGVLALSESEAVNPQVLIYLNRLSDVLFVWARLANDSGRGDVLWVPGEHRES